MSAHVVYLEAVPHVEVSPRTDTLVTLDIGADQPVILDKMYGPLIFANLRVTAEFKTCQWVIERKRIDSGEWVEVARVDGQLEHEYDEDHPLHRTYEMVESERAPSDVPPTGAKE